MQMFIHQKRRMGIHRGIGNGYHFKCSHRPAQINFQNLSCPTHTSIR